MIRDIDRKYFYGGVLGAIYSPKETIFRVWSPLAENAVLKLYTSDINGDTCIKSFSMRKNSHGVWESAVEGDLDGIYYAYDVTHNGKTEQAADINAKAGGINGRLSMVVNLDKTNPPGWESSGYVKLDKQNDAILYELHVRDFSWDESGNFKNKGLFTAFTERGLVNSAGDKIGIEHIKELGVTHVHLLPVFDYATVDEANKNSSFNGVMILRIFNFPEGSYSSDPYDGRVRIKEFKQLVKSLHDEGIGIIMDVVYNHTYSLEDSAFNKIFPRYYYRSFGRKYSDGSACGNEFATNRLMARKFILDSVCYWAQEYKIDGFRFDLMGLYDIETVNLICYKLHEINPNVILYGEGWTGGKSPLPEKNRAIKVNAEKMPLMAMFSDDFRDTVKGDVFIDNHAGFVNGGSISIEKVKLAMTGNWPSTN
jgi:pullulanase